MTTTKRQPAEPREQIRRAVGQLARDEKLILLMHYGPDGLTDAEMGEVLGLPAGSVEAIRQQLVGELRRKIGQEPCQQNCRR